MLEIPLEHREVQSDRERGRQLEAMVRRREHPCHERNRAASGNAELVLQVAYGGGSHERPRRQPSRDAARDVFDAGDVVLAEQVVEPFLLDAERKRRNCNVIDSHVNYPQNKGSSKLLDATLFLM